MTTMKKPKSRKYSGVPNKRTDPNKRTGTTWFFIIINLQNFGDYARPAGGPTPPNTNSLQGQLMCVMKNGLNWSRYMQWMDNIWSLPVAPKHTGTKSNHFWFTSGHILAHKSSIWSLPVNFRSHHSPNRPNMLYPVTSGKLPVHLDKPVIITVTSGLWPQKASEVTEVNNLKVSG